MPDTVATDVAPPVEPIFAANLERVPGSASAARSLVADALEAWGLPQLVDDARLITTELVSNAVDHAAGYEMRVSVVRLGSLVRISVIDRDRTRPQLRPWDTEQERGRGLLLVKVLSSRWGVSLLPGGKAVWSEMEAAS
jgi:anti-sigma regulatory factor (Ser/Thr protein kinase)